LADPSLAHTFTNTRFRTIFGIVWGEFMITVASQELKRRGIGIIDADCRREPVHVIRNNRPEYVILREEDYQMMLDDLALARITASEADLAAGRFMKGSAAELMHKLDAAIDSDE
jgi:PHD/YefM family antitoxin component YafN of YafNO toxin-antitoxin module